MPLARRYRLPSLTTALFGFVTLFAIVGFGAMTLVADRRLENVASAVQSESVYLRGEALRMNLSKALDREWNSVNAVAGTLRMNAIRVARPRLIAISRISNSIAWAGIADASGRLVASSHDELEGQDVSRATWFRRGLAGSHIGTAPAGDPLGRLVPSDAAGEGPVKFVDLSVAIRDDEDRVEGVLIYRLNAGWIQNYLVESARVLDLDLFLVDGRGRVLFDYVQSVPGGLSDRAAQVVASGQQGIFRVEHRARPRAFHAVARHRRPAARLATGPPARHRPVQPLFPEAAANPVARGRGHRRGARHLSRRTAQQPRGGDPFLGDRPDTEGLSPATPRDAHGSRADAQAPRATHRHD